MKAIDNSILKGELCNTCNNLDFEANLTYKVDVEAKAVTVTDTSTFAEGDDLKVVNVRVYDKDGNKVSGQITAKGGNVAIDVSTLNLASIDITATLVNKTDKTADFGTYNIGSVALEGNVNNVKK